LRPKLPLLRLPRRRTRSSSLTCFA
jgi:hypothetical protein